MELTLKVLALFTACEIFTVHLTTSSTRSGKVTIKVDERYIKTVLQGLKEIHFSLLYKITPAVYILEYQRDDGTDRAIDILRSAFQDQFATSMFRTFNIQQFLLDKKICKDPLKAKNAVTQNKSESVQIIIIEIEPLRVYEDTFNPNPAISNEADFNLKNIVCSRFYGKSVTKVWERNITGKDVRMAVTDLGTGIDLTDLKENTSHEFCGDLLINTTDGTPERMLDVVDGDPLIQDHRNNVTSITDIIMNFDTCGARFAYDATIVGMTIHKAKVVQHQSTGQPHTKRTISEQLPRIFTDELDKTDICVNTWAPTKPFDQLDLASKSIIKYGINQGRQGLGTIFVVPAGSCGNELSNNIYTISVNSIGKYGTQPYEVMMDASVFISGLRDENNSTALSMATPSYDTQCVTTFMGLSAAVSQVAGIIALGLQKNPDLKSRDVQHLLVDAAEQHHLEDTMAFKSNGALRRFHNIFGFGLLNAEKFVRSAQFHKPVPSLRSRILDVFKLTISRTNTHIYEVCYSCDVYSDPLCLINIEQVKTTVNFTTNDEHIKLEVISPGETQSVLMDSDIKKDDKPLNKKVNFVSVHFWDEVAFGKWYVKVQSKNSFKTQVHNISLTLYGTRHASKVHFAASFMTSCGLRDARNNSKDKGKQQKAPFGNQQTSPKSKYPEVTSTLISRNFFFISIAVIICVVFCVGKLCQLKVRIQIDNSLTDDSAVEMSLVIPHKENCRMSSNE